MHTIKSEITKWLINENYIKSSNDVKEWPYRTLVNYYLARV